MKIIKLMCFVLLISCQYVFADHTQPRDASRLNRGTLPNARLDAGSVTLQGNDLDISSNMAAVNKIITSSDTIWLSMNGTNTIEGLRLEGSLSATRSTATIMQTDSMTITSQLMSTNGIILASDRLLVASHVSTIDNYYNAIGTIASQSLVQAATGMLKYEYFLTAIATSNVKGVPYIGGSQTQWIAVSTTFGISDGGIVMVHQGSYTFTAGATIPWNMTFQGQGRGTKIYINGSFNALVVSGTLKDVEIILPQNYSSVAIVIKSSGLVENVVISSGSITGNATAGLGYGVFRFENKCFNCRVRNIVVQGVDNRSQGTGVAIFSSSHPIYAIMDNVTVVNSFYSNSNPALIQHIGGRWKIRDSYFETSGRFLLYDGASSGTIIDGNDFVLTANPNNGSITTVDLGADGHTTAMKFINNTFRRGEAGGLAQKFFYFQGSASRQVRSGMIINNNFLGSGGDMYQPGTDTNVIGMIAHGNLFSSSATITDAGSNSVFQDNFTMNGQRYPNDSPAPN